MRTKALEYLQQALDCIPDIEKKAYLEALQVAPLLVEKESDPTCFLLRENFNCWDAAARLVAYWDERKKVFGDKAFLPITFSTDGALSEEALSAIRAGAVLRIPNDSKGRRVVLFDQSILIKLSMSVRRQINFLLSLASLNNSRCQQEGIVLLILRDRVATHRTKVKTNFHVLRTAFPIRIHSVHLLCKSDAIAQHVNTIMIKLWSSIVREKLYIHTCPTPKILADKLSPFGLNFSPNVLTQDDLPKFCDKGLSGNLGRNFINGFDPKPFPYSSSSVVGAESENVTRTQHNCYKLLSRQMPTFNSIHVTTDTKDDSTASRCLSQDHPKFKMQQTSTINSFVERGEEIQTPRQSRALLPPKEIRVRKRIPSKFDVLLGNGRKYVNHTGNRRLQSTVESLSDSYAASSQNRKEIKCLKRIVFNFVFPTGRFLKFDKSTNTWYEVQNDYALEKIGQAFRNHRKKQSLANSASVTTR